MGSPFSSLRVVILIYLAVLITSAMLLINAVMLRFAEKDLLEERIRAGKALAMSMTQVLSRASYDNEALSGLIHDHMFKSDLKKLAAKANFSDILLVDGRGRETEVSGTWGQAKGEAVLLARQSSALGQESSKLSGSTWGVIWFSPEYLLVSAPIPGKSGALGAITIRSHLEDIYTRLRRSERVVLLYTLLNSIVLLAFGSYLLSRSVIRPINKLLKITDEFHLKETFSLPPEPLHNEMGRLYRSLNMMLKRLEENKTKLKSHIKTLERTNQELKKAQEEIIRSEKMASVGRLATGIAHEIGNPIGIVLGYLDLLKRGGLEESESRDFLERMESEVSRINSIIRQLLDFSRPTDGKKKAVKVNSLLQETVEIMKPQPMMRGISVTTSLDAPMDTVLADPNQLKQVFLNIIMNAADAINESFGPDDKGVEGSISIETKNDSGYIEIRVRDNGPGLPEEAISHVFDPFFTTKEPGKGTGLGLSVSYSIVDAAGGSIEARNHHQGAEVIIRLPLHGDQQ